METIQTIYAGELRTSAKHLKSGVVIFTDAPADNKGKGESFSPTDLLAASLGTCMLTIMGIAANEHGFNMDGTHMKITKIMASNPRRVCEILIEFDFPPISYSEKERKIMETAAINCPVAKSLHPDIIQKVVFNYK